MSLLSRILGHLSAQPFALSARVLLDSTDDRSSRRPVGRRLETDDLGSKVRRDHPKGHDSPHDINFYKTENGARVGDLFMALIHSAELAGANSFDYLVALQRHHQQVATNPGDWMPWNCSDALARIATATDPAS